MGYGFSLSKAKHYDTLCLLVQEPNNHLGVLLVPGANGQIVLQEANVNNYTKSAEPIDIVRVETPELATTLQSLLKEGSVAGQNLEELYVKIKNEPAFTWMFDQFKQKEPVYGDPRGSVQGL